ncbi:MAG: hypothetical protein JW801_00970 [Bacteroidales bacterium]|nr:hypothetical protein [Bacteroidales bacterium]
MNRTLIVYGTRKGTTGSTAAVLAETLILRLKHEVELVNIRRLRKVRKHLDKFDNIIVGSSIVNGRWKRSVLRFLRREELEDRKIALFITAGNTMHRALTEGMTKDEARELAIRKYISIHQDAFHFSPVAKTAFGGIVQQSPAKKVNTWSREDIEDWAVSLKALFEKEPAESAIFHPQNV